MTMTHRENIPFFNELPQKALKAATRLWDASHDPAYNGVQAYSDFVQDLTFAGITAPPRSVVKRWLAGVQAGMIGRPAVLETAKPETKDEAEASTVKAKPGRKARQSVGDAREAPGSEREMTGMSVLDDVGLGHLFIPSRPREPAEEVYEKLTPATFGGTVFSTLMEASITPPEPSDERPDPALALVARQMVEEEVARINMNVRVQATANVAARLRQMAVCLEGGAA